MCSENQRPGRCVHKATGSHLHGVRKLVHPLLLGESLANMVVGLGEGSGVADAMSEGRAPCSNWASDDVESSGPNSFHQLYCTN